MRYACGADDGRVRCIFVGIVLVPQRVLDDASNRGPSVVGAGERGSRPRQRVSRKPDATPAPPTALGTLTLIGAGELMPAMSKAHRAALARVSPPRYAVFLDTTAGFESNADAITAKAVEYYAH